MASAITVVLADDQELFVENLRFVLEARCEDISVVGVARNGAEAVELVEKRPPDIVLMDIRMPVMDGVEATRRIVESHPDVRIVMLTTFDNDEYVYKALQYGAVGYLMKSIPPERLFASIRAVKQGAVLISPSIAQKLARTDPAASAAPAGTARATPADAAPPHESLTDRERDILKLVAMAYANREIADKLQIGEQTVKNHLSVIYAKFGVSRRMELMRLLHESGNDPAR